MKGTLAAAAPSDKSVAQEETVGSSAAFVLRDTDPVSIRVDQPKLEIAPGLIKNLAQ
jgi:hypothetical protein